MLKYIIEFLFCSAAFMAFYKLLLEGRVSHSLARNYLVVTMFVSLFIPMLELPLYPAETIYYEIPIISTHDIEAVDDSLPLAVADADAEPSAKASETEIITFEKPTRSAIDWAAVLARAVWVIYLLITLLNLARFVWRIYIIGKLRRHSDLTTYELYTLAVSDRVREPFSFWRTIFTNRSFSEIEHRQIISHELSHIRHHHTAERLALELLRCVAWFNPFVWLAGTALVEVHEWEADSDVLSEGYDVYEYRQLIFRQLFGYHPNMTNGLSSQTSKKRFLMMTNFKKGKFSFVRFGAILPVVAVLVFAFGAVRAESEIVIRKGESSDVTPTPVYNAEVVISSAGELNFNGKQLSLDELKAQLAAESDKIEVLNIKAEKGARMGVLEDVKLAAREAKVFRIRYVTPPQNVDLLLPPLSVQSTSEVKVLRLKPDDRNRLPLFVNANGKVLTRHPDGDDKIVDMAQLKQIVKQFVDNTERVDGKRRTKIDHYSDFKWDTISMSDGGVRHYPVSCGYITIITTRDTDIDKYIEIEQVVRSAYAELRDELAQLSYRKSYASLDDDARSYIHQAIPIRINYADEYHPMFEKPVEPAQKVSVAVSPQLKSDTVTYNRAFTTATTKVDTQPYNRAFTKATPIPTYGYDSPFMKMTDIIYLTVDDEFVTIKEGESKETTKLPLREMVKTFHYPTSILSDFITRKASTKVIEQKWASGKVWSYPVSNAVIVVDAKKSATVADVRRARDWARWAILNLRATVSARMTNVVYGRLCERDCEVLETAIPMNVVLTRQAENILNLSPETDVIYNIADRLPRYHGKEGGAAYAEFADWLEKQFDANKDKKEELKTLVKSHGTFFAKIVIEKDGSLSVYDKLNNDLDGQRGIDDLVAEYLEYMCAASPKWKPAKHNGKPVRAQFSLFIKRGKFDVGYEPPFPNLNQENADKSVPRGVVVNPKQSDRYSNYQVKIKIKKVTLTDEQTVVDLYVEQWHNWWVRIESNSVLMTGDKVYPIQDVRGAQMDVKYWMPQSGKAVFQLIFPPIDCKTDKLTFAAGVWRIDDIDLSELTSGVQRDNIELNNLTSKMQGGEKIPAGYYQVSGFDTKHEWTKLSGEAMKYVMDTAPRFVFGENNEVEIVSPVNNDYIKSGKYSYKLTLDKKQFKSHGYIERKGNIEFANGDNHYNYPCTIRQHEEDESSYNLQIYFNHYISDIDVDVKFILFSLFE